MSNLNKIILIGKLTETPSLKSSGEGTAMTTYNLAVKRPNRPDGSTGETDFIDIISWGRQADLAAEHFKKGALVLVEGRIQVRSYDDAAGQRKWATEVSTTNIVLLDEKQSISSAEENKASEPAESVSEEVAALEDVPF